MKKEKIYVVCQEVVPNNYLIIKRFKLLKDALKWCDKQFQEDEEFWIHHCVRSI